MTSEAQPQTAEAQSQNQSLNAESAEDAEFGSILRGLRVLRV